MLRATDRTSRIRLPLSVLGALWLALLALFALLAASQATGSAHVTDENDHLILRRPHTRSGAFQPGDRSGLRNLSTWLIVALVAAAFAAGLAGGAFLRGGPSKRTPMPSSQATSTPATSRSAARKPVKISPAVAPNPAAAPTPSATPPVAPTPAATPKAAASNPAVAPNSPAAPTPSATPPVAPTPAATPKAAAGNPAVAPNSPAAPNPAVAPKAAAAVPAAAPNSAPVPTPSAIIPAPDPSPPTTIVAATGPSPVAGATSPSEESIVAACTRLQAPLGNPASAEINFERLCHQAARGDTIAPDRIVRELCVELTSASPMLDEQLLASCQTN